MSAYDKEILRDASAVWTHLLRDGERTDGAILRLTREAYEAKGDTPTDKELQRALFAARWAGGAFFTIDVEPTYAAAIMSTPAIQALAGDIECAGLAVMVRLPRDLIVVDVHDRVDEYDRILVYTPATGSKVSSPAFLHIVDSKSRSSGQLYATDGAALLLSEPNVESHWLDADGAGTDTVKQSERAFEVARRCVAGVLYTMQHTTNFRDRKLATKRVFVGRRGPPMHRVAVVGRPVSIDCRDAVRSYVSGTKRGLAAVQTLVRGHYQRQVFGPGRLHRKVIWKEPYWRGPEDAPILARPYQIGTKEVT